ncbi:MAG: hypothetical protein WBV56_02695 [Azonexus sp.]
MNARIKFAVVAALLAIGLSACGERPQVVQYRQGTYSGKPDTPPWDNARFGGNKQAWVDAVNNRAQSQNEYKSVN